MSFTENVLIWDVANSCHHVYFIIFHYQYVITDASMFETFKRYYYAWFWLKKNFFLFISALTFIIQGVLKS